MKYIVDVSEVEKRYRRIPGEILMKVREWVSLIEEKGLYKAQIHPGYRDHSLYGKREGQRSVYLNRKWRLIYVRLNEKERIVIRIKEICAHEY